MRGAAVRQDKRDTYFKDLAVYFTNNTSITESEYRETRTAQPGMTHYGERALFYAMIEQARVDLFRKNRHFKAQCDRAAALEWVRADDEGDAWTFTFTNCCEGLGLDPEYVRRGILNEFAKWEMEQGDAYKIKSGEAERTEKRKKGRPPHVADPPTPGPDQAIAQCNG